MARSKKKKPFRAVTAVKALARERIGEPRPGQVVPDRKKKTKGIGETQAHSGPAAGRK